MQHLVIIGSGPAGIAAAQSAHAEGLGVTIIEQALTGGTCLNHGCIPTKMLLGGSESVPAVRTLQSCRLGTGNVTLDFAALMNRKDRFIRGTRQTVEKQFAANGITLIRGKATSIVNGSVRLLTEDRKEQEIACDAVLLATGSRSASFPGLQPDGQAVLDSNDILGLATLPRSLLVVGAGAIGLELGEFFHRMGTKITIIEAKDRLAPTEEPEVGKLLARHYTREGWKVLPGRKVMNLVTENGCARLTLDGGEELQADKALVAVGRLPNSHGLGLEDLGVRMSGPGWVRTDDFLRATPEGAMPVHAIGDVNGRTLLAHAAEHQARYVVAHLVGKAEQAYAPAAMPACIYGHMEVIRAGATEEELRRAHPEGCATSRFDLIANPIAQSHGTTSGFVKVCWYDGKVYGITAAGHGVTGLITTAAIIAGQHWTQDDVRNTIFAHPTLDEALAKALEAPRTAC